MASAIVAVLLAATACSSGEDSGTIGSPDGSSRSETATLVDESDPTAQPCVRWTEFAAPMDSDAALTDELIDEVLERQRRIEEVLPATRRLCRVWW